MLSASTYFSTTNVHAGVANETDVVVLDDFGGGPGAGGEGAQAWDGKEGGRSTSCLTLVAASCSNVDRVGWGDSGWIENLTTMLDRIDWIWTWTSMTSDFSWLVLKWWTRLVPVDPVVYRSRFWLFNRWKWNHRSSSVLGLRSNITYKWVRQMQRLWQGPSRHADQRYQFLPIEKSSQNICCIDS